MSRRMHETLAPLDAGQINARQQHGQLTGLEFHALGVLPGRGQTKRALFEPLVPDRKAIGIPVKNLQAILAAADEQEQMPAIAHRAAPAPPATSRTPTPAGRARGRRREPSARYGYAPASSCARTIPS